MKIRDYRADDADALVAVFQSAVLEGSAPHYTPEQRAAGPHAYRKALSCMTG